MRGTYVCAIPRMATTASGWLLNNFRSAYRHVAGYNVHPGIFLQTREYAARKGTREKARKKKVKVVVQKVGFIPHKKREAAETHKKAVASFDTYENEINRPLPIDDVYIAKYYRWKLHSFEEAIANHRETHHPTMYNLPTSTVSALIELNMKGEKKKVLDSFQRVLSVPHKFKQEEERNVLVFSKSAEVQEIANKAGASLAGGRELIKSIQAGEMTVRDYDYCLAHVDIYSDLLLIRGLMKRKFPNTKTGTLGTNMQEMVEKFKHGVKYLVKPHELRNTYAIFEVKIGTLDMDTKHLKENFVALIKDINCMRPKRDGPFITRVRINSPPTKESFKICLEPYLQSKLTPEEAEEEEDNRAVISAM